MSRAATVVAGAVVALLVVGELVALPLAGRVMSAALERCIDHEQLTVERAQRPVLPRLAVGRVRDVELTAQGLRLGALRVASADLVVPEVRLPWAIGPPGTTSEAVLDLEVDDADLEAWLRTVVPLGVPLTLELAPGEATLGVEGLGPSVTLRVEVVDGVLTVRPSRGDGAWWRALGIAAELELPADVHLDRVALERGHVRTVVRIDDVAGLTDGGVCAGPLGELGHLGNGSVGAPSAGPPPTATGSATVPIPG